MEFSLQIELPIRVRPERPMSDDELMHFCRTNDALRVEREPDGELIVMSPASSGTGLTNSEINLQLALFARETGAGAAFDSSAGFTLADGSMRNPDASLILWPRWKALPKQEQNRFARICPDFVIELRSPSDSLPELQAKMRQWIANGAELAWLVDPSRKVVEIYRQGREPEVLEGGSAVEGEGPVAGFVLELARVWG